MRYIIAFNLFEPTEDGMPRADRRISQIAKRYDSGAEVILKLSTRDMMYAVNEYAGKDVLIVYNHHDRDNPALLAAQKYFQTYGYEARRSKQMDAVSEADYAARQANLEAVIEEFLEQKPVPEELELVA